MRWWTDVVHQTRSSPNRSVQEHDGRLLVNLKHPVLHAQQSTTQQ